MKEAGETSSGSVAIAMITIRTITTIIKQHLQRSRVWSARFFNGLELYDERGEKECEKKKKLVARRDGNERRGRPSNVGQLVKDMLQHERKSIIGL